MRTAWTSVRSTAWSIEMICWSMRSSSSEVSRDEAHAASERPSSTTARAARSEEGAERQGEVHMGMGKGGVRIEGQATGSRRTAMIKTGMDREPGQAQRHCPRRARGGRGRWPEAPQRNRERPPVRVGEHGARRLVALPDANDGLLALDAVEAVDGRPGRAPLRATARRSARPTGGRPAGARRLRSPEADRRRRAGGLAEVVGHERLVASACGVERVPGGGFERGVQPGLRHGDVYRHERAHHVYVDGRGPRVVGESARAPQREHQGEDGAVHRNVKACVAEAPTTQDGTLGASVAETW